MPQGAPPAIDDVCRAMADPETKGTVVADLRALIHSVAIYAQRDRRLEVEVKGRLAALIGGTFEPATFGV